MVGSVRQTPFIGRERELAQLQAALHLAGVGEGQIVLIAGEPGIGKTRLLAEFAEGAKAEGWQVLAGRAYDSEGMPPYLPFSEALHDYVRAAPLDDLRAQLDEAGPDVALLAPDIHRRLPDLPTSPPASPEEQRYRLFESVCDFLLGIPGHSEARGLVLILDDLHWADPSSLLLFQHLARRLSRTPLLLAGAYRSEEVSWSHPLAAALADLRREGIGERLALAPLPSAAIEALVRELAGVAPAPAVLQAVEQQTEGNPFFVGEVVRDLLANRRDLTAPATALEAAALPEGVREVIERRLMRLSRRTNSMLQTAAILGDGFSLQVLRAALGSPPLPEGEAAPPPLPLGEGRGEGAGLPDALDEATGAGMLREASDGYQFGHALIRQALYDGLGLARRQELHLRAAEALERVHAGNLGPHAAALAMHYRLAGGQGKKALDYAERAAERALASYAYAEAARHLEQALELQKVLDPDDQVGRCDLLLALGDMLQAVGEPLRAAREAATEALACAEAAGDQPRALRACQLAIRALIRHGATGGSDYREWAEQADRRAQPETPERAQADFDMVIVLFAERRFRSASERNVAAQELARRLGNLEARYRTAAQQSRGSSGPGEAELRAVIAELAVGSRVGVSPRALNFFLFEAGCSLLGWGDLQAAGGLFQELREIAAKTRYPSAVQRAELIEALASTLAGRWEEALARAEAFMGRAEELGNPSWAWAQSAPGITRMRLSLGRADDALTGVDAAIPRVGALATVQAVPRALCLAALGRLDEARTVAGPLLDPEGLGPEADYAPTYLVALLLEVAVALQDREAVVRLAAQLSGLADQVTIRQVAATAVGRHLGAAAALLGDPQAARGYLGQALEACEKIRFRPEIALTRLQMAELLLTHYPDERAAALEHLDFAIAEFREMKMQPALERALQLEKRATETTPLRRAAAAIYPDGLSEREVEVLRLVAEGKSNQAIADTLVISLNTVLHHMGHIFTKTNAANRAEAATYAHRHGLIEG